MSILAKIFDKIFPWADGNSPAPAQPTPSSPSQPSTSQPQGSATVSALATQTKAPIEAVDVEKNPD